MNKQPEITDATREAFVTAFFQLAKAKDIRKIPIREITNLAGYNRTTFYRYFDDVFDLIEYVEDDFYQNTVETLSEQAEGEELFDKHFFETFMNCFRDNTDRLAVLMSDQNRAHFIRRMRDNAVAGMDLKYTDTPRKKVVNDMFFFGIFAAMAANLYSTKGLPDDDLLGIIQSLFRNWYWPQVTKDG